MKHFLTYMILVMVLLTGCDGKSTIDIPIKPYPVEISNITVEKQPKIVASLSPVITAVLEDLGYTSKLVGVSSDYKVGEIKTIGTALSPDYAQIAKLAPEIVFSTTPIPKIQMDKLTSIQIKVAILPACRSLEELKSRYSNIVKVMDGNIEVNDLAVPIITEMNQQLAGIKDKIVEKPTFIYVSSLNPVIATGDTFESDCLSMLGKNLVENKKNYNVTPDEIAKLDPQMIFFSDSLDAQNIKESKFFKDSLAVANNKLFAVDHSMFVLQNKEITIKIRELAMKVFPNIMIEPN